MSELIITHPFPPVYDEQSRVLVLGTFPSPRSRTDGFYYGHPRNRFWRVLAAVFDAPTPRTVEEKTAFLLDRKIAMWDVLASCAIEGAADATIKNAKANDFSCIFRTAKIETVFVTGKTAEKHWKKGIGLPCVCLPSPSPANCATSDETLIGAYMKIKEFIK